MLHAPAGLILVALLLMACKQGLATDQTTGKKVVERSTPHLKQIVEIELLTWPEIYKAIHEQGKTTVDRKSVV